MSKRLLKDLPFENLKSGTVIYGGSRGSGEKYSVSRGETYYREGGSSSNGTLTFDKSAEDVIDIIWDNPDWFEEADLKHIDIVADTDSIILRFKPIDKDKAEDFAKGIIHILPHLQDGSYTWKEFKDITTSMVNQ